MFDTHNAATLPSFFNGLPLELKHVAIALTAGATTAEIARALGISESCVEDRKAHVVARYHAFMSTD